MIFLKSYLWNVNNIQAKSIDHKLTWVKFLSLWESFSQYQQTITLPHETAFCLARRTHNNIMNCYASFEKRKRCLSTMFSTGLTSRNPLPHKAEFWWISQRKHLNTLWETKKMLVTSIFFISHHVFSSYQWQISSTLSSSNCRLQMLSIWTSLLFLSSGNALTFSLLMTTQSWTV